MSDIPLAPSVLRALRAGMRGPVLVAGDDEFDTARSLWNGMIDIRPGAIARCLGAADVMHAVTIASEHGLRVSVRGGGHNVAGLALCSGGLTIDVTAMRSIRVDADARTVRAEPGVTWADFDREVCAFGLATTGGMVSSTGIAGLTLGGGLGWLMSRHGLACDNLLAADIVTADGRLRHTNANEHADLFWAIRGGGGNFGVVTSFEYRVHPMQPRFPAGMVLYSFAQAREVLRKYRDVAAAASDDLTVHAALLTTPDGQDVVGIAGAWLGDASIGLAALEPLRTLGTPIADLTGELSYPQLQTLIDAAAPKGLRRYWKSGYFPALTDELIDRLLEHTARKTSPLSLVLLLHMHGEASRVAADATAFGARATQWDFDILPQWTSADEDARHIGWAREFWQDVEAFSRGVYSNHLDSDDGVTRVRAAYGANFARLSSVKRHYDPGNFFRVNNNIPPAPAAS